ncbi:MAG TPA: DsbA family protein [Acidimicrobiia bacterium]|nr:DsbA family protein [Acidimicrobiia bacterium]
MRNRTKESGDDLAIDLRESVHAVGAPRIEMFADVTCPFAYFGLRRLIEARDARGSDVTIRVRAWPLEWINGRQLAPDLVASEIVALRASIAPQLFVGFDAARFPTTSIGALGLVAAAYRLDARSGEQLSVRVREALFEEGRDLTDDAELRAIGRPFGVEPLSVRAAEAAVRADWERGRARGVRGSPHFFSGHRSWFCPSLRVRHDGPDLDITVDPVALEHFLAAALG